MLLPNMLAQYPIKSKPRFTVVKFVFMKIDCVHDEAENPLWTEE